MRSHSRSTGLGGLGRWASQILHARTSASRRSNWAGSTRMIKSVLFAIRAPLMPPHSPPSPLNALSPLDGRYHKQLEPLRACFSEAALFRYRIAVEIRWLLALAAEPAIAEIKPFSKPTHAELERIIENFSEEDAAHVKAVEAQTNHDVKAIEYWVKKRLAGNPEGARVAEFVHFACTSEDINNLAYGLMLKEGRDRVLLPALDRVIEALAALAVRLADAAMLARTHGQPASPTTLGKELANVVHRLRRARRSIASVSLTGKMNGAVGNYNAHVAAYPDFDWERFARAFVESLGLEFAAYTTQIEPHDSLSKLEADPARMLEDLEANWEVLGEAVQTVMRRYGLPDPYEQLKALTRGKRVEGEAMRAFIRGLKLPEAERARLLKLTPAGYIGKAAELARKI